VSRLPENWTLCETGLDGCASVRVVTERAPDGRFELKALRATPDADVYLGALCDDRGGVQEWLELWVQRIRSDPERPTNGEGDARWRRLLTAMGGSVWWTGTEGPEREMGLVAIDPETGGPLRFENEGLVPCRNEAALSERGGYAGSTGRWFWSPESPERAPVPAWDEGEGTSIESQVAGGIPFNVGGGFVAARRFAPFDLATFTDMLAGEQPLTPGPGVGSRSTALFFGRPGQATAGLEILYLRLSVLRAAVLAAQEGVRALGLPLLSLTPSSFGVRCDPSVSPVAWTWTASVDLVDGGCACRERIGDERIVSTDGEWGSMDGIYRPLVVTSRRSATATLRFRGIDEEAEGPVGRGTVVAPSLSMGSVAELARIRFPAGQGATEIWGEVERDDALASGEVRLVTRALTREAAEAVRRSLGVEVAHATIEIVSRLSSACDVYSLGVIGVRTLLTGRAGSLSETVDEVLSLARASEDREEETLAARVHGAAEGDERFGALLGPHRALGEDMDGERGFEEIPATVWWPVVAALTRFFPGATRESYFDGPGRASSAAPETAFAGALEDLDRLVRRSRSLLVVDWSANREIHRVVRRQGYLSGGATGDGTVSG